MGLNLLFSGGLVLGPAHLKRNPGLLQLQPEKDLIVFQGSAHMVPL